MSLKRSPLYPLHRQSGAQMVEFAGWELPVQFSSILEEHRAVRDSAGLFDVSHLGRVYVRGPGAFDMLQRTLTNDLAKARPGRALYTLVCQKDGGVIDDLLVFHRSEDEYLLVPNASNTAAILKWLKELAHGHKVDIQDRTAETAMLAFQGPQAAALIRRLAPDEVVDLPRFGCLDAVVLTQPVQFSRTGYTGEDGFELIMDPAIAEQIWRAIIGLGVKPCGLGARDTLRLEAALSLYGNELDTRTTPIEAGLDWAVALGKGDFVGKDAIIKQLETGLQRRLVCFRMTERAVPRTGYPILKDGTEVGRVTSGNYSPTLRIDIGMGYVPLDLASPETELDILIRDKPVRAQVVHRPFYKQVSARK